MSVPTPDFIAADLTSGVVAILNAAAPMEKVARTRSLAVAWLRGHLSTVGTAPPPDEPARPARPVLLPPREMPKRRAGGSRAGRIALLHALAHIELNAVDLAWDLVARFAPLGMPREFLLDWVQVASEEAEHFALLAGRLRDFDSEYGALPAHHGLWEAAAATRHDLLARLAIVPLVLEARGLDVTPAMIERLDRLADPASADILRVVYQEEIGHVATGRRWFAWICAERKLPPVETYHALVRQHFRGLLKPPFNEEARRAAGLGAAFYLPLAAAETT